jgi:hypothetical protein
MKFFLQESYINITTEVPNGTTYSTEDRLTSHLTVNAFIHEILLKKSTYQQ